MEEEEKGGIMMEILATTSLPVDCLTTSTATRLLVSMGNTELLLVVAGFVCKVIIVSYMI